MTELTQNEMSLRERVARAICAAVEKSVSSNIGWVQDTEDLDSVGVDGEVNFLACADAAIAALPAWQPIETALKNGEKVLVWCDGEYYVASNDGWGWFNGDVILENMDTPPTHWHPLPQGPKP